MYKGYCGDHVPSMPYDYSRSNTIEAFIAYEATQAGLHYTSNVYIEGLERRPNHLILRDLQEAGWDIVSATTTGSRTHNKEYDTLDEARSDSVENKVHRGAVVTAKRNDCYLTCAYTDRSPTVFVESPEDAFRVTKELLPIFTFGKPEKDEKVEVRTVYMGQHGVTTNTNRLDLPKWSEIADNYTSDVKEAVSQIMDIPERDSGIIVWTGDPGTGKTTAVRALIKEWNEEATISVVADPETFLGSSAYFLDLCRKGEDDKHHLIILEDSGELIEKKAKVNVGQALARLLNMSDGIIGQTNKVVFLITTNEKIGDLHEAVTRSGRCLSNVEFSPLSEEEARSWCERHERPFEKLDSYTLSNLYMGKPLVTKAKKQQWGFGA